MLRLGLAWRAPRPAPSVHCAPSPGARGTTKSGAPCNGRSITEMAHTQGGNRTVPVITMLNQKGGVGKTSTCHHVAGTLAQMERRVLLVDNDPQASLTQGFWGPQATRQLDPSQTIAALYAGYSPFPDQVIHPTGIAGVDLLPGSRQ